MGMLVLSNIFCIFWETLNREKCRTFTNKVSYEKVIQIRKFPRQPFLFTSVSSLFLYEFAHLSYKISFKNWIFQKVNMFIYKNWRAI